MHQLIVVILGTDSIGVVSEIANVVSESSCNILDSRQTIYGKDFSFNMIIEGSYSAITQAEIVIPAYCQKNNFLSMMKRTSEHEKQSLSRLCCIQFSGEDAPGQIKKVSNFLACRNVHISAFRQQSDYMPNSKIKLVKCKLMVSLTKETTINDLTPPLMDLFKELGLNGNITSQNFKDSNEHIASWD